MLNDSHVLDSLPAYVLGSLEEEEARQVAEHTTSCYQCRSELDSYQDVADQLLLIVPEAIPSGELKLRLMKQVRSAVVTDETVSKGQKETRISQSTGWRFPKRMLTAGALAGLFLIVVLAVSNLMLWERLTNAEVITGPLGMRAIALQNTDAAPDASGFVILSADGQNGVLVVDHLPPLDESREYQLWLVRDGQSTSGAVFEVDEEGYRGTRIEAPESLLSYTAVRVTIEPVGGSKAPGGEQVLGGSLFNP